ncbi:hypothetical protein [Stenotrophomonas sp. GZD-301]|uniref:hypothetical protein n=1 Tax=Stenotrophomonas sp. GZD-301 TaxID=3404814 RepID=UPI003BB68079
MSKVSDDEILHAALEPNFWRALLDQTDRRSLLDPETAKSLAALHNASMLDLVSLSADAIALEGQEFFFALHLISSFLPSIDADQNAVKDAVLGLHSKASPDLVVSSVLDAFGKWAAKRQGHLDTLINMARGGDAGALELLPQLINASNDDALVARLLQSTDNRVVTGALLALSWKEPSECTRGEIAGRLLALTSRREEDGIARRLLPAAVSVHSGPHESGLSELLAAYEAGGSLADLYSATEALSRYARRGGVAHTRQLIGVIEAAVSNHPAGLPAVLSAFTHLATTKSVAIAGESIRRLSSMGVPEEVRPAFKSIVASIVANRDHAPRVIADWLAYGDIAILSTLSEVIGIEETPATALKVDFSEIPSDRWNRAAYAAAGWLFTNQFVAVNCLLWMLKHSVTAEEKSLPKALLDDVFLKNYGGVFEMLCGLDEADTQAMGLSEVVLGERERLKNLESLDLPELQPSEQMNFIRREIDERSFQAAGDAVEPSALMAIFPTTQILYGTSVISSFNQLDGDPGYREIAMNTFSIQFERPRMLTLDPLKLDMILLKCRKRGLQ